jgi:phosphohistidine phosphatase SixA
VRAVPVFLIRHAHAGSRSAWSGDDAKRPLSKKGQAQAQAVAAWLADQPVGAILSSPSRRCVQTAEPLAEAAGVAIQRCDELAEGADPDVAVDLVLAGGERGVAIVGHGDLIPRVLGRLVAMGMDAADPSRCQKGSLWVIEVEGGRPVRARYEPPSALLSA